MNVPTLPPPPEVVVISDVVLPAPVCLVTVCPTVERAENPVAAGVVDPVPPPKAACCRPVLTCAETGVIKPHASPRAAAALMKADLFMVLWIEIWVGNAVDNWGFAQHSHPVQLNY